MKNATAEFGAFPISAVRQATRRTLKRPLDDAYERWITEHGALIRGDTNSIKSLCVTLGHKEPAVRFTAIGCARA